jgi:glycosyltransferase involved in cell wall biosynthesis
MAPFTGCCHHSLGCDGYKKDCLGCPAVRIPFRLGVNKSHNSIKVEIKPARNFQLVAPSGWLAERAQASSIFSTFEVQVIENPIDSVFFSGHSKSEARKKLGLSQSELVCAMVASQLDNPHKGISTFSAAFFSLANKLGVPVKLLLIGSGGGKIKEANTGVVLVGAGDSDHVARNLCAADFLVSVSRAESSGLVIREAGALSVPALVLSNGGSDELIQDGITGLVFESISSLLTELSKLITKPHVFSQMGLAASIQAEKKAKPSTAANRYLQLYEELHKQ